MPSPVRSTPTIIHSPSRQCDTYRIPPMTVLRGSSAQPCTRYPIMWTSHHLRNREAVHTCRAFLQLPIFLSPQRVPSLPSRLPPARGASVRWPTRLTPPLSAHAKRGSNYDANMGSPSRNLHNMLNGNYLWQQDVGDGTRRVTPFSRIWTRIRPDSGFSAKNGFALVDPGDRVGAT